MVNLVHLPVRGGWWDKTPVVVLTLSEFQPLHLESYIMRTVFTIELKCDIAANDEDRRKAFIDLTMKAAETLYGQAAMMVTGAPTIIVSEASREGKQQFPLFGHTPPE